MLPNCSLVQTGDPCLKKVIQEETSAVPRGTTQQRLGRLSNRTKETCLAGAAEYRELRQEATRSTDNDRDSYQIRMATSMKTATTVRNFSLLFKLIHTENCRKRL